MSTSSQTQPPEDFDPRTRRLCPDGACIGLLDSDNRCKVCGRQDADAAPVPAGPPATASLATEGEISEEAARDDDEAPAQEMAGTSAFNPERPLCPDGACIGVIGDDGRCRACGRSAGEADQASPAADEGG